MTKKILKHSFYTKKCIYLNHTNTATTMNIISAIIIDSNKTTMAAFAKQLQSNCPLIKVIDQVYSPIKALATIQKKKPMCVFVDLKANDTSGFEIIKALHPQNLKVIITSLHANFALQAIHAAAFDYILKPVQQKNLSRMYERIQRVYKKPVKEERSKIKFSTQRLLICCQNLLFFASIILTV